MSDPADDDGAVDDDAAVAPVNDDDIIVEEDGDIIVEEDEELMGEEEEEKEPFISIFEILDAPRNLPEPIELTTDILKEINTELGIITLCWPVLKDVEFENRTAFPRSYLENNEKEKLLLLYAENFRRQFQHRFPDRKQLFLASDNECGLQVRYHLEKTTQTTHSFY